MVHFDIAICENVSYSNKGCAVPADSEYTENANLVESVTGNNVIQEVPGTYNLLGWIFSENADDEITMKIEREDNTIYNVGFQKSDDVYAVYSDQMYAQNAKECRFSVSCDDDLSDCILNIYLNGEVIYSGTVKELSALPHENIHMSIDVNEYLQQENYTRIRAEKNVNTANLVVRVYQISGKPLAVLALFLFAAELVMNFVHLFKKQPTAFMEWLIKFGFLMTALLDLLMVSINYFDAYNREVAMDHYTVGVLPSWQIFVCLTIIFGINCIKKPKEAVQV